MENETPDNRAKVKEQFGANAAAYVTSRTHAKGYSLTRIVELAPVQPDWQALDIATGAGHTALAFAPHVAHVVATDLTPQMLEQAAKLAARRGIENISFETADAEALPFDDGRFDLVTCRIASHHFPHIDRFLTEAARVLKPDGYLIVDDNIVPEESEAAAHINEFETLRDPSHARCLSLSEWETAFTGAGLQVTVRELIGKQIDFASWAARLKSSPADIARLEEMLHQGPQAAREHFNPVRQDDRLYFHLKEGLVVGRKAGKADINN